MFLLSALLFMGCIKKECGKEYIGRISTFHIVPTEKDLSILVLDNGYVVSTNIIYMGIGDLVFWCSKHRHYIVLRRKADKT